MAKYGWFKSGGAQPDVEYDGDYIEMDKGYVRVFKLVGIADDVPPRSSLVAAIHLGEGQEVRGIKTKKPIEPPKRGTFTGVSRTKVPGFLSDSGQPQPLQGLRVTTLLRPLPSSDADPPRNRAPRPMPLPGFSRRPKAAKCRADTCPESRPLFLPQGWAPDV